MSMDEEPATVYVNNDKISVKMCRICLRSDNVIAKSIDERLLDFYNEITDVNVFAHPMLSFCPLCEYKLRKFYNFKQICLRSNYILKRKITNPGHMDLGSLPNLIPRDLGFSMPNDRRGLFEYKCHLFMAEQNSMTETKLQTDIFKIDDFKTEVMIDTDLIKTEVDRLLEDPIKITDDNLILEKMGIDKIQDEMDIDASVNDESIENDASEFNYLNDDSQDSDYLCDSDLSEDEMPLRKNKTIKKGPLKTHLSCMKTHKQINTDTRHEKITAYQLSALLNEPYNINNINYADLMCMRESLSPQQKNKLDFRLEIEHLKQRCLNLLDEGKIDLGEVKLTKEMFLELFAKCDTSYIKTRGYVTQMENIPKLKKFMLYLHRRYNPEYETIFKIDYLITREQKIEEFESRKNSKQYIEAIYKCEECYLPFTHRSKLDYHKKYHDPKLPFVCDICPTRFLKRSQLQKHQTYHYSVYRCKQCAVFTYYFSGMLNHYNQHKGKLYTCDICLGQYGNLSTLNGHRLSHARLSCEICARKFHSQKYLDKHMELKHANSPPTRVESLAGESRDTALSCDKCDAVFKSQLFLRRHMTKHETLLYKCRSYSCLKKFSSASELREHALSSGHHFRRTTVGVGRDKSVHKRSQISYKNCHVCDMAILNTSSMSMYAHHQRSHPYTPYNFENEYNTLCEQCGISFWHYGLYLDHLNTHSGEKPYKCKDCDARYSSRRLLYSHRMKVHCRLHKCKDCGKTFYNRSGYINHIKVHTGEKPHECHLCGKKFTQIAHLKTHKIFMHSSNRPFACELCNKRFKLRSCLTLHMMVHTGQRPHPCELCDKQFYRKRELKAHDLKMHS